MYLLAVAGPYWLCSSVHSRSSPLRSNTLTTLSWWIYSKRCNDWTTIRCWSTTFLRRNHEVKIWLASMVQLVDTVTTILGAKVSFIHYNIWLLDVCTLTVKWTFVVKFCHVFTLVHEHRHMCTLVSVEEMWCIYCDKAEKSWTFLYTNSFPSRMLHFGSTLF